LIRLVGAGLIVFSGLRLGMGRAHFLRERARAVRQAGRLLELIQAQTRAKQPLHRICTRYGELEGYAGSFFHHLGSALESIGEISVAQAWRESAERVFGGVLDSDELGVLESMGAALSSGEGIELAAQNCIDRLNYMAVSAEDKANRDGYIFTALGTAMGAALAIVLV